MKESGTLDLGLLEKVIGFRDGGLYHYSITRWDSSDILKHMRPEEIPWRDDLRDVVLSEEPFEHPQRLLAPSGGLEWDNGIHKRQAAKVSSVDLCSAVFKVLYYGEPQRHSAAMQIAEARKHQYFAAFLSELDQNTGDDQVVMVREHFAGDIHFCDAAVYLGMTKIASPQRFCAYFPDGFDKATPLMYDPETNTYMPVEFRQSEVTGPFVGHLEYRFIDNGIVFNPWQFELVGGIEEIFGGHLPRVQESLREIHQANTDKYILIGIHQSVNSAGGIPYVILEPRIKDRQLPSDSSDRELAPKIELP